jgi:hypothetical protein
MKAYVSYGGRALVAKVAHLLPGGPTCQSVLLGFRLFKSPVFDAAQRDYNLTCTPKPSQISRHTLIWDRRRTSQEIWFHVILPHLRPCQ